MKASEISVILTILDWAYKWHPTVLVTSNIDENQIKVATKKALGSSLWEINVSTMGHSSPAETFATIVLELWVVILTGMANTITDENEAPYEQDGIAQGSRWPL